MLLILKKTFFDLIIQGQVLDITVRRNVPRFCMGSICGWNLQPLWLRTCNHVIGKSAMLWIVVEPYFCFPPLSPSDAYLAILYSSLMVSPWSSWVTPHYGFTQGRIQDLRKEGAQLSRRRVFRPILANLEEFLKNLAQTLLFFSDGLYLLIYLSIYLHLVVLLAKIRSLKCNLSFTSSKFTISITSLLNPWADFTYFSFIQTWNC